MVLEDYNCLGMDIQILLPLIDFGNFSHDCRDECYPQKNYPDCYGHDNGDSYFQLVSNIDQVVRLLFPGILMLVYFPMLTHYFNVYVRAHSLGSASQIKFMG
jgi:hypothetical protein